jgi:hypothetical protein
MGAHTLVGSPEAAPSPSVTTPAADICDVLTTIDDYVKNGPADVGLSLSTIDVSKGEDPAVLAAIHAQGQPTIDFTKTFAAYLRHASDLADDPDAAAAFDSFADAVETEGQVFGVIAIDATSVEDYVNAVTAKATDPDYLALQAKGQKASDAVTAYALSRCDIDLDAPGPEQAVKMDASTLGKEIATFFVDWKDGDALPNIVIDAGSYYLDAAGKKAGEEASIHTNVGAVSSGVVLVDQEINSPVDWCVSVGFDGRDDLTYRYSATGGLEDGTCAARADE